LLQAQRFDFTHEGQPHRPSAERPRGKAPFSGGKRREAKLLRSKRGRHDPIPALRSSNLFSNERSLTEGAMLTLTTPEAFSPAEVPVAHDGRGGLPKLAALGAETARDLVQLFKLLADETRLRIMYYLMQKEELNVRTLCRLLEQSQPAVSHHLALLRVAGIIECRRDGKHNFYRLVPKRCQAYLDTVFGVSGHETRKVRVEDTVLTYGRDGEPA
jgi:ArsR family transcriptional regulator, arsenate/arsenite/antimonite-responsive transcriptional repressor